MKIKSQARFLNVSEGRAPHLDPTSDYSLRRAIIGSTFIARRAGI
jgi:hypothetical protein